MTDLIRKSDADAAIVACKGNGATRQACRDAIAALPAVAAPNLKRIGAGLYETQPAPDPAPHVNKTLKAEHDADNTLTDPAAIREAALREAITICREELLDGRSPVPRIKSLIASTK